jgi:hypothetical protein
MLLNGAPLEEISNLLNHSGLTYWLTLNLEYAGTPLELLIPKCNNSKDWAISRVDILYPLNDYQKAI